MVKSNNSLTRAKLLKQLWTPEEDKVLTQIVSARGAGNWAYIAKHLPSRIGKQCRERWYNHLCPSICKAEWSPEEKWVLFLGHTLFGSQWRRITHLLPGRTDNSIKNCWNSSMKKLLPDFQTRLEILAADATARAQLPLAEQRLVEDIACGKQSATTACSEDRSENCESRTTLSALAERSPVAKDGQYVRIRLFGLPPAVEVHGRGFRASKFVAAGANGPGSEPRQPKCFVPLGYLNEFAGDQRTIPVFESSDLLKAVTRNVVCFDFDEFFQESRA